MIAVQANAGSYRQFRRCSMLASHGEGARSLFLCLCATAPLRELLNRLLNSLRCREHFAHAVRGPARDHVVAGGDGAVPDEALFEGDRVQDQRGELAVFMRQAIGQRYDPADSGPDSGAWGKSAPPPPFAR